MVLLPFEKDRISSLRLRGIPNDAEATKLVHEVETGEIQELLEPIRIRIRSRHLTLTPSARAACRAFLAYYAAKSGLTSAEILEYAKKFALHLGLAEMPQIEAETVSRLKLDGLV